jgi:hypothetical protein
MGNSGDPSRRYRYELTGVVYRCGRFQNAFEDWAARQQLPGKVKRGPVPPLSASEVMTTAIHFRQASYRNFKHYYQKHVDLIAGLIAYTHQPKKPSIRLL